MNKKTKSILLVAVFALSISLAVFAYNMLSQRITPQKETDITQDKGKVSQTREKEKTKAPNFSVLDIDGNSVMLSDFLGKPVVLNFWASWCPPCKGEMPEFNEVYQEVGKEVTFMMVDLVDGQRETKEKGAKYVKDQGYSFPVYFDVDQDAASTYNVMSIPMTIFIGKDGSIMKVSQGAIDAETLRKGIGLIK